MSPTSVRLRNRRLNLTALLVLGLVGIAVVTVATRPGVRRSLLRMVPRALSQAGALARLQVTSLAASYATDLFAAGKRAARNAPAPRVRR